MKLIGIIILTILCIATLKCTNKMDQRYMFFLHNKWLEDHNLNVPHPQYGIAEYKKIINAFKKEGFDVISEKRKPNTDIKIYARKVVRQVDSLINIGVKPNNITIVGTSKGGIIAEYVSTFAKNPQLNFVFIGASFEGGKQAFPDLNLCGNILSINEKSDEGAISLKAIKEMSNGKINNFKEIEVNTGEHHGFLFALRDEWFRPTINWAKTDYE